MQKNHRKIYLRGNEIYLIKEPHNTKTTKSGTTDVGAMSQNVKEMSKCQDVFGEILEIS